MGEIKSFNNYLMMFEENTKKILIKKAIAVFHGQLKLKCYELPTLFTQ